MSSRANLDDGGVSSTEVSPVRGPIPAIRRCTSLPRLSMDEPHDGPMERRIRAFASAGTSATALRKAEEYGRECAKQGIVPVSLDVAAKMICAQRTGQALVGDRQVSAWCAAGLLDDLGEVQLRDSDVGPEGAKALAERLGKRVVSLDLCGNSIGSRGAQALGAAQIPSLEVLVLSKNGLGDAAVTLLCEGLKRPEAPQLLKLLLSENQISRCGRAIADLLGAQQKMTMLDLHWNYLTGDSAVSLFEGVEANHRLGGSLARLDVSWNCLGNSRAKASMISLSRALKGECALVHLDLSYNSLPAEACGALGQGLRDNHTLLGLHLVGNAAAVDADGFVVPSRADPAASPMSPSTSLRPASASRERVAGGRGGDQAMAARVITQKEREAIRATFRSIDTDGSGTIDPDELQAKLGSLGLQTSVEEAEERIRRALPGGCTTLDIDSFTAVMESFILQERQKEWEASRRRMEMERDRSSLEARTSCWICESWQPVEISYEGEACAVWAFTSIDNFQRATKLTKEGDGRFTCQRMLPPDQVCVVLQVDNGVATVAGLDSAVLPDPISIRLRHEEGLPALQDGGSTMVQVSNVSVLHLGGPSGKGCASDAVQKVPKRAVVIDDPSNPGGFCVKPRITETEYRAKQKKAPWDFKQSIFSQWRFETPRLYSASFGADWPHTKVHKFLKERAEQDEAAAAMKEYYSAFLRLYRRCAASASDGGSTMGVSMMVCMELLNKAQVLDDQYCKMADIDTMFIAARVREKGADKRPLAVKAGDMLLRFQFMEFLVRIAVARYFKTKEAPTIREAIAKLFNAISKQVEPLVSHLDGLLEALHTEACDAVLRSYEGVLQSVFRGNSGRWAKPGEARMMCCKEFEAVLTSADAFNDAFLARDVTYAFQIGLQLYPDELFDLEFAQMSFLEFLHGLGAAVYLRSEPGALAERLDSLARKLAESEGIGNLLKSFK